MRRREFIAGLGSAAILPPAARGQSAVPVGFLNPGSPESRSAHVAAFRQGLSERGLVEGRDFVIEFRWAENHYDRLPALAADLTRRGVAVIAADGAAADAAKAATATVPIVFVTTADPIGRGLVASINHPGGNATGLAGFGETLVSKRLEMILELVPNADVIGWLVDPATTIAEPVTNALHAAAARIGHRVRVYSVTDLDQLNAVFATARRDGVEALIVERAGRFLEARGRLVELSARYAMPAIYEEREFATDGGLISYTHNLADMWRQAGIYVGRVLKGEKPGDLPVQQPTKFDLAINLRTAKALGLTVPESLLATADEVIE